MKRSLKALLTLALAAFTGYTWAEEVYKNPLAGDVQYVFNGKTYSATKFTALTALTENDELGNFDKVIYKVGSDNDTQTHTFAMWVMLESLSDNQILWWVHGGHNGEHSGYAVKAMGDGGIRVGKTNADGAWNGGNYYTSTTKGLVKANTWTHVALAVTKTADARTATSTLYVNGVKIQDFAGFPTNLNGSGGSATVASVGANVTAANVYVDDTVLDADAIRKLYVTSHEAYPAAWTWDGTGGTETADALPSGATVYTVSNYVATVDNVPAKNFTFSFWTKRNINNWIDVAGFGNDNNHVGIEKGRHEAFWFYNAAQGDGPDACDVGFALSDSTLQMVTIVVKQGVVTTYVDGTQVTYKCEKSNQIQSYTPTTFEIVGWNDSNDLTSEDAKMTRFSLGRNASKNQDEARVSTATIADARVYASALSADEIRWAYLDAITSKATIVELSPEGVGPHDLSDLTTSGAGAIVKVTLEDGATLNIDTAINWNKLIVASDGDATVVAGATATLATLATEGEGLISFTASGDNKISATKVKADANTAFAPGIISPVAPIAVGNGKVLTVASPTEYASVTGGTLRYAGGDAIEKLDFSAVTSANGTTIVAKTVNEVTTVSEMDNERADGYLSINRNRTLIVEEDGVINVGTRLAMNDNGGGAATLTINGGTINVDGEGVDFRATNGTAVLLGHWGSSPVVDINRGTLDASKGGVMPGWDGSSTLTVGTELSTTNIAGSAVLKAKGMGGKGAVTIKPSGKIEIGSLGITTNVGRGGMTMALAGGELAIIDDASLNFASETSFTITADSTISVASGKTATLNTLLSGTGTLTVTGGGKLVIPHAVAANVKMNVVEGTTLELAPSAEDVITGKLTLAEGTIISGTLSLIGIDEFETDGSNVTFEANAAITGSAWWWDYEFNGSNASSGSDTGTMTLEGSATSYTTADANGNQELYFQKTPWRDASFTSQNAFTAVMYCQPGAYNNAPLIGFGSTTANDKVTVVLATGANAANGEMQILLIRPNATNSAFDVIPLADNLIVPNATTAKHLYAFTYDVQADKTVISVYVDGKLKKVTTINEQLHVSNGFQIGSLHGGVAPSQAFNTGLTKYPASGDAGTLDFLRVAKGVLSAAAMSNLADTYKYVSENGEALRTIADAEAAWVAENAWTQQMQNEEDATQAAPNAGTNVVLTATADTQVTVNLEADASYETLKITGSNVTLVAGEAATKIVAGDVTIDANVTIPYGVAEIGTLTVNAGKTLTFDFSEYDFASAYVDRTISLTSLATVEDGAVVTAIIPEDLPSHVEASFAKNEVSGEYELTITVTGETIAASIGADGNWDSIIWALDGQTVAGQPDLTAWETIPLAVTANATLTMNKVVALNNLTISGEGNLTVTGNNLTVTGATTIDTNVTVNAGAASLGSITITNGKSLTIKETIANVGTITSNAGELVYAGGEITEETQLENTIGKIRIASGTVDFTTSPNGNYTNGLITIDEGATMKTTSLHSAPVGNSPIVNNGAIVVDSTEEATPSIKAISGTGTLTLNSGTLTLGETNTYTGETTVNGGTLTVSGSCALSDVTVGATAILNGTGTVKTLTLADGATLAGPVTVTGDVTVAGALTITHATAAGDTVITCANAEAVADALTGAPEGLRYVAENGAVKLAVAKVNVKIPTAPDHTKWYMGETEVSGTIEVNPNTDVILTLKADEGYVFADGTTEKKVSVNAGETGAEITAPEVNSTAAQAKIGETPYLTFAVALANARTGDTITLLADATITARTTIDKSITLDLNGQTIAETMEDQFGAIYVKKGATLTIKATNGGEITTNGGIVIGNYGTVVVNGGTIAAGEDPEADVSIYNFYYQADWYGTTTINGGTVARIWNCGIATLAGGTVTDVDNSGAMTITGATVANIILRDGSDAAGVEGAGTLTAAEGLTVTTEDGQKAVYADGKYTVVDIVYVAQIGTVGYETFADALAAAQADDTITLLANVEASFAQAVTINLNGNSLTGNVAATIVMNNGKYYAADGSYMAGPDGYYATTNATFVLGANAIEIAAGDVSITKEMNTMPNQTLTIANGASFTVSAGKTINVLNTTIIVNGELTIEGTVKLGGTYAGTTYTAGTITAAEGLNITSGVAGYEVKYADGKYSLAEVTYVAQVGGDKYATLQAAIDAAEAGAEVTVIANIVTDGPITVTKQVTVNLNDQTIEATNDKAGDGVFCVTAGGDLTINGEGTVNALGDNGYCMAVWADGGKVTINGGTYTNVGASSVVDSDHFDLIYVKNGGSAIITGGTFICETPRWTLNSHNTLKGTISVMGGTFKDFNPADVDTDDGVTTWCAAGYVAIQDGNTYIVKQSTISGDIIVDNTESGEKLTTEAVTVLEQIAADNDVTITKVEAVTEAQAEALNEALQVFEEIVAIEGADDAAVAKVGWNFGIADIERNGNNVVITAKVTKGDVDDPAAFANGVKVIFTVGTKVYEVEPSNGDDDDDDGVATVEIPLADIDGEISVKAKK